MADIDPFSQVYDWLWDLLEANTSFATLVKPGNRIRFDGTAANPVKEITSDADYPEVMIELAGGLPTPVNTSSSSSVIQRFAVSVSMGTLRLAAFLPLKWAIYCGLAKWLSSHRNLKLGGQPFVVKLAITSADEVRHKDGEDERGTMEWFALWYVDVEMFFRTASL